MTLNFMEIAGNKRVLAVRPLLLACALSSIACGEGSAQESPQTPVASDGSTARAPSNPVRETNAFMGTGAPLQPGQTNDARANFRSLKTDDLWKDLGAERAKAPGAREVIIGTDDRIQVMDSSQSPASAVVYITWKASKILTYSCTGFLIGSNTVATAGHCVAPGGKRGGFYDVTTYKVYVGLNSVVSQQPYGACSAKTLYSVSGWVSNKDSQYDYGAIKLNCAIGATTGYFGLRAPTDADLQASPLVRVMGYPGDKTAGTVWYADGSVIGYGSRLIDYNADTYSGMSGSAVFDSAGKAVAVHTTGFTNPDKNEGTRMTADVVANFGTWISN